MEPEDFLAHHGVKGMKWGVRRKKKRAIQKGLKTKAKNRRVKYKQDLKDGLAARKANKPLTTKQAKAVREHRAKVTRNVTNAAIGAGALYYTWDRYGPLYMEGLRIAAVKVAKSRMAREGAKTTANLLKEVGSNPTASLSFVDGVWKLVK